MHRMELHGDDKVLFLTCLFVILHYVFLLLLFFSFFLLRLLLLLLFLKLFDKLNVYSCARMLVILNGFFSTSIYKYICVWKRLVQFTFFLFWSKRAKNSSVWFDNFRFLFGHIHSIMISTIGHKRKSSLDNSHTLPTNTHSPMSTLTKRFRGITYDGWVEQKKS